QPRLFKFRCETQRGADPAGEREASTNHTEQWRTAEQFCQRNTDEILRDGQQCGEQQEQKQRPTSPPHKAPARVKTDAREERDEERLVHFARWSLDPIRL